MRVMAARGVNEIAGVGGFLRRWLLADARPGQPVRSQRSATGNINLAGSIGASRSALLAPADPGFLASVEPGVRALVAAFVAIGAITYTSCEGHRYDDGALDERHVGVLVRNDAEARRLDAMWHAAEAAVETALDFGLMRHAVASDGRALRAMDFYLARPPAMDAGGYFAALPAATEALAAVLPGCWQRACDDR